MHVGRVAALWGLMLCGGALWAQPTGFSVGVALPDRYVFRIPNPNYLVALEQWVVSGTATLAATANPADYIVLVNGVAASTAAVGANPRQLSFSAPVPLGPTQAPAAGWAAYTYSADLRDADHIAKPIVAEVLNVLTGEVVAKHRVIAFDGRVDAGLDPSHTGRSKPRSMLFEATGRGLNRLEVMHAETLPQPTPAFFNSRLTRYFAGAALTQPMNTTVSDVYDPLKPEAVPNPKACAPLNQAPAGFQNTGLYRNLLVEANTQFAIYKAAKEYLDTGAISQATVTALTALLGPVAVVPALATISQAVGAAKTVEQSCVRELPAARHFEICSSSLRGVSDTMSMQNVASVDLSLPGTVVNPPQLLAQPRTGAVTGIVDGELRSIFIRWAERPKDGCKLRPEAGTFDNLITPGSDMDTWRRCSDLSMTAASATMNTPLTHSFASDSSVNASFERHEIQAAVAPSPLFTLGADRTKDVAKGICGNIGFQHDANALLDRYWGRLRYGLDSAWSENTPLTQEAVGLDRIFRPWETGTWGEDNLTATPTGKDHKLIQNFDLAGSRNIPDRIAVTLNTDAELTSGPQAVSWVFSSPGLYPCHDANLSCGTNRSGFGEPFDVSYSVTTGALNQVIKELSTTPLMTFDWEPTYEELGVAPPAGKQPTDKAVLDGPTLSVVNPKFADLGPRVARVSVRPVIMPYTYINPEPPNVPAVVRPGRENLTYQLVDLEITLKVNEPGVYGDGIWLKTYADVYDSQLELRPSINEADNRLTAEFSDFLRTQTTVTRSSFAGCPLGTQLPWMLGGPPPWPQNNCANQLGASLFERIRPKISDAMLYMLNRFPAPQVFDAAGAAANPLLFELQDTYRWAQVITFYGNLR